jgi:nucleoside-diphosphate-sugar epimerase
MRTLVTGGAGFIGSHLVRELINKGREVIVFDDLSRGRAENLMGLGAKVEFRSMPLRDYARLLEALKDVETVFHLAARVGSVEFLHGSDMAELLALQTNLVIDANVFRACLEVGIPRLVYASSVSVYPIDLQSGYSAVFGEDDLPYINPEGGYGWAKLVGEIQLKWMRDMKIGIGRIFNIYGEGEEPDRDAHVVPALIRKAILYPREEFEVWGNGNQTRDLLHVDDCVDALLKLEAIASSPPAVLNIGSGEAVSVKTLVGRIIAMSGKAITPIYKPTKPVGPLSRTADVSKARMLLGWHPRIGLEEGLARTFRWVERRLGAAEVPTG